MDSIRHSVFCTGFRLRDVENPAMKAAASSPPVKVPGPTVMPTV